MNMKDLPTKLYHGTINTYLNDLKDVNRIDPLYKNGKKYVDNGQGFYLSSSFEQAVEQAKRCKYKYNNAKTNRTDGLILTYEFNKEKFCELKGKFLILFEENEEWSRFILNNRLEDESLISGLHNRNQEYDMVYSLLADGRTALETLYFQENDDKIAAFKDYHDKISNKKFKFEENKADQMSFHGKSIIKECLTYKNHSYISELDSRY